MGVQGWNHILREEGYIPETVEGCTTSLWRSSDGTFMDHVGDKLERLPPHSTLILDGNGMAFFWHRIAYARHIARVVTKKKNNGGKESSSSPSSSCHVKLGKNGENLSPCQVRRLIPTLLPLSQLSAVVSEFIKTLQDKHHMKVFVYWDGEKRRVYKRQTDQQRQQRRPEEQSNLRSYCETGIPPPASTVCDWEKAFPKNKLFKRQIMHTLDTLQVPSVECDEEADAIIAGAARGKPSVFILGMDSDFCFFPDVQYIPLNTLDAQGHVATAVVLRRNEIANTIGLPSAKMMTELAILCGNDYIHPDDVDLDYQGGKHVTDVLNFLRQKPASYVVTSISEDVEESLRFVRNLYELEDLEEYPFEGDRSSNDSFEDDMDEAGDTIVHFVSPPTDNCDIQSAWEGMPLNLCVVNPLLDTSAKDAVLRCLQGYLDLNLDHSKVTREHIEALRKLPLDSSGAQLVQHGDWRPRWDDVVVAHVIEVLIGFVYGKKSAVSRILPPFVAFDQHKFHAYLRVERGEEIGEKKPAEKKGTDNSKSPRDKRHEMQAAKVVLPIDEHQEKILASIKKNRVTIIQGETGCGKSSRVPVMILRSPAPDPEVPKVKLFMSQPRRIAAKGLVERVRAVEPDLRDQVALRMGFGVREYEGKRTRAWFVTTGYLVRLMAKSMESLKGVSHLIIDEVHERSVDTDILCLLCRRLLKTHSHIRLILMSATLAANLYRDYFGAPEPPLVVGAKRFTITEVFLDDLVGRRSSYSLPGKANKVAEQIFEECNKMKCNRAPSMSYMTKLLSLVSSLVVSVAEPGSSVLIFVPGMNEIVGISELIETTFVPGKRFSCIPVHSDIPFEDQMKVFEQTEEDECRVIIATNSAESSVTLPELNTVICLGLAKQITYNELSHRQMLEPVWISRASATQRAGRTGRIAPGTVIRLYSRECYHQHMLPFEPGELCRIPLDSVILTLKDMMGDDELVTNVLQDCIEPPNINTIDRSFQSLYKCNFITTPDDACHMTALGYFALAVGIDLSLCQLIGLGIQFGVGREAIQLAAILSFPKTPWQIPNPMLQSPNEFNGMVQKTFVSKCDFDGGLFSEPFSIMNLLWDYNEVPASRKKQWCFRSGVSHQRVSRLSSTVTNIVHRVATFRGMEKESLMLECPPRDMPAAKLVILRVIQTWVFHDTMIQCRYKQPGPSNFDVKLLAQSDPVDETVLDQIFMKERHKYKLSDPREIQQKVKCILSVNTEEEFSCQLEAKVLSYATSKEINLVWIWKGSTNLAVYISKELAQNNDFAQVRNTVNSLLPTSAALIKEERTKDGKIARGIEERCCGKWVFCVGTPGPESDWFLKYSTVKSGSKKMEKRVASLISEMEKFSAKESLSIDASRCNPSNTTQPQTQIVVVSRGPSSHDISVRDLKDMVGALGEIVVKTKKKRKGLPVISFPVESTQKAQSEAVLPMIENAPEAMRLFSVMASRRRTHHVAVQLEQVDEADSVLLVELFPEKNDSTQLSRRWRRFNSDDFVYVDGNSPVSSVLPICSTGTIYCVAANALETKGGTLKAEGLTLLPPSRLFFLLCRISFGLLKCDLIDGGVIEDCLRWIAQDQGDVPANAVDCLRQAAMFHNSFDAGEELVCLPNSVATLLGILDVSSGNSLVLWDTKSDPFYLS